MNYDSNAPAFARFRGLRRGPARPALHADPDALCRAFLDLYRDNVARALGYDDGDDLDRADPDSLDHRVRVQRRAALLRRSISSRPNTRGLMARVRYGAAAAGGDLRGSTAPTVGGPSW